MKETDFIEQHKRKWNRFEQAFESQSNDPEELSELYMDITDDLSYAQTFYPKRTVKVYLNQLAQRVYTGVHKQKGESLRKFLSVWRVSLPLEIYRARKSLVFALVMFLIYAAIGALTTYIDPDFPRIVMGDFYVDMTLQNIQDGNPLKVYESDSQMDMFMMITTNNLKVAFLTFAVGFLFTFGTHILLFSNGVMLGAFQYFFHSKGLLLTSFLGIWIHGAFEISAIVLAGGAGITAGNGLLFPGSYTRLQSLQLSTKRGLKIMLSLVPFIIAAGFLESFVTHNYQVLPEWSKWTLILLCFGLIVFYYVLYPAYVARRHPELVNQESVPFFKPNTRFNFIKMRSAGENIADAFRMYGKVFGKLMNLSLVLILPLAFTLVVLQDINHYAEQQTQFWYDWASQLEFILGYGFHNTQDVVVLLCWFILFSLTFTGIFWAVKTVEERFSWRSYFSFVKERFLLVLAASSFLLLPTLVLPWYLLLIFYFFVPFFYLNASTVALADKDQKNKLGRGFKYSSKHYGNSLVILLLLTLVVLVLSQPFAFVLSIHDGWRDEPMIRDLLDMLADFVKRVAQVYTTDYMFWANVVRQVVYVLFLFALLPLIGITAAFGYYTEKERNEANGLKKAFEAFGKRSKTQEMEADYED